MGINSHVASGVEAEKEKSEGIAKFARESLLQLHEAVVAETNSNLLLASGVKGPYFFGLHTIKNAHAQREHA